MLTVHNADDLLRAGLSFPVSFGTGLMHRQRTDGCPAVGSLPVVRGRICSGMTEHVFVDLPYQRLGLAGQRGVGLKLLFLLDEVVVGLGLLERCRPILADHYEGGQEDRFQRDDERQLGPRVLLQEDHPDGEDDGMDIDERHRTGEGGDAVGQANLEVLVPGLNLLEHGRVFCTGRSSNQTTDKSTLCNASRSVDGGVDSQA